MSENVEPIEAQLVEGDTVALRSISDESLREIVDFDSAARVARATYGSTYTADAELGNGFSLLQNKDALCGIPVFFVSWSFNQGDMGQFVSAYVIADRSGSYEKYVINDGGTGVCKQLVDFTTKNHTMGGLFSRHGLRRSDYPASGDRPAGTTYYIDTSR